MSLRRVTALFSTVAMLLLGTALPAAAAQPEKATGDVTWSTDGGLGALDVHTTFVAHDSGKGEITNVLHQPDGTYVETWSGSVTCFVRDGEMATFGGTVTTTDHSGRGHLTNFVVRVWDNGEGAGVVDQINSGRTTNTSQGCTWLGFPALSVTGGNLQVHS